MSNDIQLLDYRILRQGSLGFVGHGVALRCVACKTGVIRNERLTRFSILIFAPGREERQRDLIN